MMSRRKKQSNDTTEARQKRVRSFRSRERRQQRKQRTDAPDDLSWLTRVGIRMAAMRVLNEKASEPLSFWLSAPLDLPSTLHRTVEYYPCRHHRVGDRVWYGFMFREHRDAQHLLWPDSRKELTPDD